MNMKNKSIIFIGLLTMIFTGCKDKKDQILTPKVNNPSATMEEFFENNGAQKQDFTINVDNAIVTITGEQGTKVSFPEDAFVDLNNQPVSGDIQIELLEIYDQATMLLSEKPTTSNGQLLVSGGEVFIGATANGETLQLSDDVTIKIELPAPPTGTDNAMTLFTGSQGTSDTSQFNWVQVPNVVVNQNPVDSVWIGQDTTNYFFYNPSTYIFTYSQIGWINCDRFYNSTTTSMTINCNGIVTDNSNLRAFLVFHNINSVLQLWADYSTVGVMKSYNVPVGEQVTVVVFYFKDGKEYMDMKDVTITTDLSISVDLTEHSEEQIVALAKQKFN